MAADRIRPDDDADVGGRAGLLRTFRALFALVPIDPRGSKEHPSLAALLEAIRIAKEGLLAEDKFHIERSKRALAESRAILQRLPRSSIALGAVEAASAPSAYRSEPLTAAQWVLYFCAELWELTPHVSEERAFRIAKRLHFLVPNADPEVAAVSMAAGLSGSTFQQ